MSSNREVSEFILRLRANLNYTNPSGIFNKKGHTPDPLNSTSVIVFVGLNVMGCLVRSGSKKLRFCPAISGGVPEKIQMQNIFLSKYNNVSYSCEALLKTIALVWRNPVP